VTLDSAALATDGRYFNQAASQLDDNWTLLKQGLQDVPTWQDWSAEQSSGGKNVGVDPTLISGSTAKGLAEKIRKNGGAELVAVDGNLVDMVWGDERPARPSENVIIQPDELAGESVLNKLNKVRQEIGKKHSPGFLVSMLDEIAWLFNLRGSDIPYNPVFFAYATVTPDAAKLYIDDSKLSDECRSHLTSNKVEIKPYDAIFEDSQALHAAVAEKRKADDKAPKGNFLISNKGSWALKRALGGDSSVDEIRSLIGDAKAIKTEAELKGMRDCHVRDGASLIQYFAWLEDQLVNKKVTLDEVQAADKLEALRKEKKDFVGLSFPTISSTGAK
jgi:Xaa-Pro aminopeptidase